MTKHEEKELKKKLQKAQQAQDDKIQHGEINKESNEFLDKINKLEKENIELNDTCKRAQFDYINLKSDMDIYQRRILEKEANMQIDILINTVKKFIPFVEELRKSLENISEDHKEDPLSKGLQMTYDKFLKKLEEMHIKTIETIGQSPDSELHEPISIATTDDKKLKGKIIQEFSKGFIYEKDGQKKVISPAKVIVGQ